MSCEPLLSEVNLRRVKFDVGVEFNALTGQRFTYTRRGGAHVSDRLLPAIDLVIGGGESGPGARPTHPDWARSLRDQCAVAGVAWFWKQWGQWGPEDATRRSEPHAVANDGTVYKASDIVYPDGPRYGEAFRANHDKGHLTMMYPVGKARAGALLDGVVHRGMPV